VLLFSSGLTKLFKDLTAALTVPKSTAILGTPSPISDPAPSVKSPTPVKSPVPPEVKSPPPAETKSPLLPETRKRAPRRLKYSTEKLLATYKDTDDFDRARDLLGELKKNEKVYWNEATGQVVINKSVLSSANIAGLVNDTLAGKRSLSSAKSLSTFKKALKT
jgi:hypothetical protein